MSALERIQETQDADQTADDYRLWLTSMPTSVFPVPVLQKAVKMTNEPPKGLKFNLTRTFADITAERYEMTSKPREFKKLLFALSFFHAVILERRKFGPIGWNIAYEWMASDFQVSMEQLALYLDSQPVVPYQTLNYLVAEVNYGGRVTDDKDVRLISAILKRYITPKVLDDDYKLSSLQEYYAPAEGDVESARAYIKQLPSGENPKVFGLHPNAMITAMTNEARRFHSVIVEVQPRISGGGGGKTPEELVSEMAEGFQVQIPATKPKKQAHPTTYLKTADGGVVSLGVFHGQELERFARLTATIFASLAQLLKAIKGLVVMSAELEDMFNCFTLQRVPKNWADKAYPCLKPLNAWVTDLVLRVEFMNKWLTEGTPLCYWVPSFFFPQGFMTASMQVYARETKIPIDTLAFQTQVMSAETPGEIFAPPEKGVYINGPYLQGCGFELARKQLSESEPGVLFVLVPVMWLQPKPSVEINFGTDYMCPLYKTSERKGTLSTTGHSTNFVGYINLPTDVADDAFWVRRGVALLMVLDD